MKPAKKAANPAGISEKVRGASGHPCCRRVGIPHLGSVFKENFLKIVMRTLTLKGIEDDRHPIVVNVPDAIFSVKIESIRPCT